MLVGHFAVSLAAKRMEPKVSLGTLALAAMLADLLWSLFIIIGLEQVQFKPGKGAANYLISNDIAISHSLATDGLWAVLFAGFYFLGRRYTCGTWILFVVVLSHWLLDFVSHRPDMPLASGVHTYYGLSLWASIPATIILEGGIWIIAVILYARATHPRNRIGIYLYWSVVAILTLVWYNNITGPPPRDPHTAPVVSLAFFSLAVAWAYWMDSLRPAQLPGHSATAPTVRN